MAHQSGIKVSDELAARFVKALNDTTTRALKVSIVNESLEATDEQTVSGSFDEDFARVSSLLHDSDPCYVLVRQDTGDNKWLFCAYIPDSAKVRDKMLYASTRATATKMLGDSYFVDSLYGTTRDEFSLAGYEQHRRHEESSAPLTERELELERIKEIESSSVDAPTLDTRKSHVTGVSFDIDDLAREALSSFAAGTVNFVLLAVDSKNERVLLDRSESLQDHEDVAGSFPEDVPRFAYYWYDSTTVVFIYACPSASSVRERMLYSTFRAGLCHGVEKLVGVRAAVRMEVDEPRELTAKALEDEVGLKTDSGASTPRPPPAQTKFKRPAPPGRRPRTTKP